MGYGSPGLVLVQLGISLLSSHVNRREYYRYGRYMENRGRDRRVREKEKENEAMKPFAITKGVLRVL